MFTNGIPFTVRWQLSWWWLLCLQFLYRAPRTWWKWKLPWWGIASAVVTSNRREKSQTTWFVRVWGREERTPVRWLVGITFLGDSAIHTEGKHWGFLIRIDRPHNRFLEIDFLGTGFQKETVFDSCCDDLYKRHLGTTTHEFVFWRKFKKITPETENLFFFQFRPNASMDLDLIWHCLLLTTFQDALLFLLTRWLRCSTGWFWQSNGEQARFQMDPEWGGELRTRLRQAKVTRGLRTGVTVPGLDKQLYWQRQLARVRHLHVPGNWPRPGG